MYLVETTIRYGGRSSQCKTDETFIARHARYVRARSIARCNLTRAHAPDLWFTHMNVCIYQIHSFIARPTQILAGSNDTPQRTLLAVSVPLLLARLPELQRGSEAFAPALHQADVKGRFKSPTPVEIIDALPRSYAADLHAAAGAAGPCRGLTRCGSTLGSEDTAAPDAPACSSSAGGSPSAGSSRGVRVLDTPVEAGCGCGRPGAAGWDGECVICTEGMAGRQVCISLPCGHSFHDR
jgi:hypothetical protein